MQEKPILKLKLPTKPKVEIPKITTEAVKTEAQELKISTEAKEKVITIAEQPTEVTPDESNRLKQKADTEQYNLVFKKLHTLYPNLLNVIESKPLAIGICRKVMALELFEPIEVKNFFKRYTKSKPYLKSLIEGVERIDLDGKEDGVVNIESARFAAVQLGYKPQHKLKVWSRATGVVKFYHENKKHGFIKADDGSGDIFVHEIKIKKVGLETLVAGQKISYQIKIDERRNQYYASKLKLIADEAVSANNPITKEV